MASTAKAETDHVENLNPAHEPLLTGALALANLFSNCVETFGLIYPSHKSENEEQLLLSRLGIQQARLLIWGQVVGITSPPSIVTNRAVPRHPSLAYPDLNEPTFFEARDERLDDPDTRVVVENALSAIIDRPTTTSKEDMMAKFGLKPPKKYVSERQVALDNNRLEAFREKFELLREVAESYAQINSRRQVVVRNKWVIADPFRFATFIETTQEKIDFLIELMGVKDGVDRGMRMDIRSFGWHLSDDRYRAAMDAAKLRLIAMACRDQYPEYVEATQQALQQMDREAREAREEREAATMKTPRRASVNGGYDLVHGTPQSHHDHHSHHHDKSKRPGLFKLFRSFRKSRDGASNSGTTTTEEEPPERSQSDAGPVTDPLHPESNVNELDYDGGNLQPVRSKSVGAIMQGPGSIDEQLAKAKLTDTV